MLMANTEPLYGKTPDELSELCARLGLPRYAPRQIARWLYVRAVADPAAMTDLSRAAREALAAACDPGLAPPEREWLSADGTKKYLYRTRAGHYVESAFIPDGDRATLCVSSQAGCRMGCHFCATGRQGLQASLTAGEILNQIASLPERERLTNLVFMGMGEPLDNMEALLPAIEILTAPWGLAWSPKRITVSTVGKLSSLKELLERTQVHVALSVHTADSRQRESMMPVQKAWPVRDVMKLLKGYDFAHQRRLSLEYIMWRNLNDDLAHADMLVKLIDGTPCRVNLIPFNPNPGVDLVPSSEEKMIIFRNYLNSKGIICTIRTSRGQDIEAACGMLAAKDRPKVNR